MKTLDLEHEHTEKIYWTSHGEIDQCKILKKFWFKDPEFPDEIPWKFREDHLFCTAVIHARYKLDNGVFVKMKNILDYSVGPVTVSKKDYKSSKIIAQWVVIKDKYKNCCGIKTRAADFFLKCILQGYELGAKYFWRKLTNIERNNLVVEGAQKCAECLSMLFPKDKNHKWLFRDDTTHYGIEIEMNLKILLWLINEMTEFQRTEFIPLNFVVIFKALSVTWPYQELCPQFLYEFWDHIADEDLLKLIVVNYAGAMKPGEKDPSDRQSKSQTLYLRHKSSVLASTTKNFYNCILRMIMDKACKESKKKVFVDDDFDNIFGFFKHKDFSSLNLIINNRDLVEYREKMLDVGVGYFKKFILEWGMDHDMLNEFCEVMVFSQEESKSFKKKLNLLHFFSISGFIKTADKHLKCITDSESEQKELKNEIDASEVCFILIQSHLYDKADKFLLWRFDTEDERMKIKNGLRSDKLIVKKIFQIWCRSIPGNTRTSVGNCWQLLKWFLGTDEEVKNFIKMKLKAKNENLVIKYWDALFYHKSLKGFDKFLKFCLFSKEEIEGMKINISNNINWWIDNYALSDRKFEFTRDLLRWVYKNDEEKMGKVIKDYMSSARGTLLFINLFKNYTEKSKDLIIDFFESWIIKLSNYSQVKLYLNAFMKNEREIGIPGIQYILDNRDKGKGFRDEDFKYGFDVDRDFNSFWFIDSESDSDEDEDEDVDDEGHESD